MKVEINEAKKAEKRGFPKLMISNSEQIVLMISVDSYYGQGVVINNTQHSVVGFHSDSWGLAHFSDFEGSITLSND